LKLFYKILVFTIFIFSVSCHQEKKEEEQVKPRVFEGYHPLLDEIIRSKDGVFRGINLNSKADVIKTVEKVSSKKVKYNIVPRREGDPSHLVADITKAKTILNFNPKHDISSIIKSAYEWEEIRSNT